MQYGVNKYYSDIENDGSDSIIDEVYSFFSTFLACKAAIMLNKKNIKEHLGSEYYDSEMAKEISKDIKKATKDNKWTWDLYKSI